MLVVVIMYNFTKHKLKPTTNMVYTEKEYAGMLQIEKNTVEQIDAAKLYRKQCCRELALATTCDIHGLYKETFTHDVDNLLVDADKIYNWLMANL